MLQISDSLTCTYSTQQHVLCVTSDVLSCCWLLVCWWETKRNLCNTLNNRQKCSRVHEIPPSAEKHGGEHTPHSQALITLLTLECEFRGFPCRSHLEMQFNLISWKKKALLDVRRLQGSRINPVRFHLGAVWIHRVPKLRGVLNPCKH